MSRIRGRIRVAATAHALQRDREGNVLFLTAIAIFLLVTLMGFVIDFSRAEAAQSQLNAIADAAALAAVDPSMIYQSDATAQAAAAAMWNSESKELNGLTNVTMTPTITDANGIGGVRTVVITFTAKSTNIFGSILGIDSLALSGSATAAASQPPNINFYVMVDNSPSMLIPDSSNGISLLQGTTSTSDGGCAFTCHNRLPRTSYNYEVTKQVGGKTYVIWTPDSPYSSPSGSGQQYMLVDPSTNKVYDTAAGLLANYQVCSDTVSMQTVANGCGGGSTISGQWSDGYWAVENYSTLYPGNSNIELRIDDASNAVQSLGPYAYSISTTNNATYALQEFFYNSKVSDPENLVPSLPSGATQIAGTPVVQMTQMTQLTSSDAFTPPKIPVPRWVNSSCMTSISCPNTGGGDTTDNTNMFTEINSLMPNPGTGQVGSTPQEVLFLITDGYDDMYGSNRGPFTSAILKQCSTIKARGIKIAVIYTQYLPSTSPQRL